jgi:hypothetical protein
MGSDNRPDFQATAECYRRARAALPGSERADVAEHAVTLMLGRTGAEGQRWLLENVLRNARHSVRRSRQRHLRLIESSRQLAMRNQPTGATRGFIDHDSPESLVLAAELKDLLAAKAAEIGPVAQRTLVGLLAGETLEETAADAHVSVSTVKRVRRQLRVCASAAGYCAAA